MNFIVDFRFRMFDFGIIFISDVGFLISDCFDFGIKELKKAIVYVAK